ncbi:hypothetical protein VR010_04025 [Actinomycetaceae bacterium L2_0104]
MSAQNYGPPPGYAYQPSMSQQQMAPPRKKSRILLASLLALIVGAGLGVLGGYFIFSSDAAAEGTRAEQNIATACEIIERVEDEFPLADRDDLFAEPIMYELTAAGQLLAATGNPYGDSYEGDERIFTLGNDLTSAMTRLDLEDADAVIEDIQEECANR